ncbi:MAG: GGDEF domain-containing protein [Nitrospinota bacterium]
MTEYQDSQKTQQVVKKLLPFMSKKKIPINPENFRVWFEYFYNRDDDIKIYLDKLLDERVDFTAKLNSQIYRKFFDRNMHVESEEKMQKEFEIAEAVTLKASELILNTIVDILQNVKYSSEYGKKLEKHADKAKKVKKIDELESLLGSLLRDTHEMEAENTEIQGKLKKSTTELESLHVELTDAKEMARIDSLTGLYNRRFFDGEMGKQLGMAKEKGWDFSLIMFDLDEFKNFNDQYGHIVGDTLLRTVAKEMTDVFNNSYYICRYGGEEISVICADAKLVKAVKMAEKIRRHIQNMEFTVRGEHAAVTLSAGVSQYRKGDKVLDMIDRADQGLYIAKKTGKNKVCDENEISPDA